MTGYRRSRALWEEARRPDAPKLATLRAILYELQPIRFSSIDVAHWQARGLAFCRGSVRLVTQTIPAMYKRVFLFLIKLSFQHWMVVGAVVLYYVLVRIVHAWLDAGPIVMILTALGAILTIGLGDDKNHNDPNRISAYSVFNRGFQRLMGSVDADDLVNQHVGGGGGGRMMMMGGMPERRNERVRRERQPAVMNRHQQQPDDIGQDNNNDPTNNAARKSGKKARRRDLQLRRELQQQRRAAAEMGFGAGGENIVMQQIIEEQFAAAARHHNDNDMNHDDDIDDER